MEDKQLPFSYNPGLIVPQGDAADKFRELLKEIDFSQYLSCRLGHYFTGEGVAYGEAGKPITIKIDAKSYKP